MQHSVPIQYTLRDLMLVFVLLASALGAFGTWGIAVAVILVGIIVYVRYTKKLARTLMYIFTFCALIGFLSPFYSNTEPDLKKIPCANNLKEIALVILDNLDAYRKIFYFTAYEADEVGKPIRSWRSYVEPELTCPGFLVPSNPGVAWDDPTRIFYTKTVVSEFICPSNLSEKSKALTNYVVVTGPHTLWPGSTPGNLNDIHDGAKNTILIIELPHSDILWAEPRDLTFEQVCKEIDSDPELKMFAAHEIDRGFFSLPDKGANVAFADGSVRCLSTGFLRKYLKAMLTRDGGEKIDFDDLPYPRPNWPRIVALIVLVLSVIALLRRPGKNNPSNTAVVEQSQTIT